MVYNFQKFEGRNIRLENRITITKSNSIGFPSKFYNDNKIKDFKYVVLYWDGGNKAVGIKFTNDENEKIKLYEIDPKVYHGRYDWEKQNIEGVGEVYAIKIESREANNEEIKKP
jgi:hypothetical protein